MTAATNPTMLLLRPPSPTLFTTHQPPPFTYFTRRRPGAGDDGVVGGCGGGGRSEGAESVAGGRHPRRRDRSVPAPTLRHGPRPPREHHPLHHDRCAGVCPGDACLKGLHGVKGIVQCSYAQSSIPELSLFAYKDRDSGSLW